MIDSTFGQFGQPMFGDAGAVNNRRPPPPGSITSSYRRPTDTRSIASSTATGRTGRSLRSARTATTVRTVTAAPVRPPRPDIFNWKSSASSKVTEIPESEATFSPTSMHSSDGGVRLRPDDFLPSQNEQQAGRISPEGPSDEDSASGSSAGVSPASSRTTASHLAAPLEVPRPKFSFEDSRSMVSAVSNYDTDNKYADAASIAATTRNIQTSYSEFANANPFAGNPFQDLAAIGAPRSRSLSRRQINRDYDNLTRPSTAGTVTTGTVTTAHATVPTAGRIAISKFNSGTLLGGDRMVPPPSRADHNDEYVEREGDKTLDEAWEELQRTLPPVLQVSVPDSNLDLSLSRASSRPTTAQKLPPTPAAPPVPTRNPKRTSTMTTVSTRLSRVSSSPQIPAAYVFESVRKDSLTTSEKSEVRDGVTPLESDFRQLFNHRPWLPSPRGSTFYNDAGQPVNMSPTWAGANGSPVSGSPPDGPGFLQQDPMAGRAAMTGGPAGPQASMSMVPMRSASRRHASQYSQGSITTDITPMTQNTTVPANSSRTQETYGRSAMYVPPSPSGTLENRQSLMWGSSMAGTMSECGIQPASTRHSVQTFIPRPGMGLPGPDPFVPVKIVPVPDRMKGDSSSYLPKYTNNFSGFCKGAWRMQTHQADKAFTLRTVRKSTTLSSSITQKTTITMLKCSKCHFEGPLVKHPETAPTGSYAPTLSYQNSLDRTPYTAHGVVYRWAFLFKSHVPMKTALKKDQMVDLENEQYACIFCCAMGRGQVYFKGARTLCGHVAREHAGWAQSCRASMEEKREADERLIENGQISASDALGRLMSVTSGHSGANQVGGNADHDGEREVIRRFGAVIGRKPEKGEDWDVVIPGLMDEEDLEVGYF